MAKRELRLRALVAPTQTVVASAFDEDGKPQSCTLAFYMVSSHVPPCVTIAINATLKRKTLRAIEHTGAFVVGFPSVDQIEEADYLGVETGYDADKLANLGYTTSNAETVHAPVIDQFALSLECEVVHAVTVGSHTQITGEVKRIVAEESVLTDRGRVDLDKLQPVIYDEEQHRYLALGEKVSDAFRPGAELKRAFDARAFE